MGVFLDKPATEVETEVLNGKIGQSEVRSATSSMQGACPHRGKSWDGVCHLHPFPTLACRPCLAMYYLMYAQAYTHTHTHTGWRVGMEDAHVAKIGIGGHSDVGIFGVFDGHGGATVAKFAAENLVKLCEIQEDFKAAPTQRT